ncbi:energy-coupling factor ABC transporter ATP-binding protein [Halarchaeum nitratireducens]|uniref:ABC transporter domain-containing protein n=1 Tax=Halarchaeum nitratireducens TaxID=489913 RepID=A0A830GCR0_9EURY|nr:MULTISPECIES: ABC transporter ATP-binding protein [Halarchaeum]MBP2252471.1 energy-coupling factor transport system ATP-binding protein [Halarchaeum solikamskense]GGN20979.1 hypothetical protein GCM10009021_22770 [Halarchaeum nitratireducens]
MSDSRPIIEIDSVEFGYDPGTTVLRGVDLTFDRGEFVTVIGQNGSGKSTLVKHLTGLLEPDEGSVTLYDGTGESYDTRRDSITDLSAHIGYVFQNPDDQIFHTRIDEEIEYGLKNIGVPPDEREERIESVLEATQLEEHRYGNPFSLSIGERQRLAIASVLAMEPDVICVDEPTTGQDHAEARKIMDILQDYNDRGHTVVAVTHDMGLAAEYTDRVVVVKDGDVIDDGPPEEVFLRGEVLEESNIRPPQITQVGIQLEEESPADVLEEMWLTVEDAYDDIESFHRREPAPTGVAERGLGSVDD